MITSNIALPILNGLFGLREKSQMVFPDNIYIGLLVKMPNDNLEPYADGTYYSEPDDDGYFRVKLDSVSRITGEDFIAPAVLDDPVEVGEDAIRPAYVTNQSLILFPETNVMWAKVVGFGLFRSATGTVLDQSHDLPFLWGTATSVDGTDGVTIKQHEVPLIREGSFKISLM